MSAGYPSSSVPSMSVLWRMVLVSPSGLPQMVAIRAPSEALAVEKVTHWRPEWSIKEISRERTLD